jgi:hypothetical protein
MKTPHVVSFSSVDQAGRPVRFTASTDIIDYPESSRTFGREDLASPDAPGRFQRRMIAVPDRKAAVVTPMVFTISNDNGLYLVRRDEGTSSGWKLIDLGGAFTGPEEEPRQVHALGAAWTDDDRMAIAVAVDDGADAPHSRVFVAYNLSSRDTDWEHIAWIDCGTRPDVRVEGIRVLDAGDGSWTVVLAGDRGPNDTLYLLRSTSKRTFARAFVFNPAVTLEEILDFEAGVHPIFGGGLHVLGTSGGVRVLAFRPFPSYDAYGRITSIPPVVLLPCPPGANVVETGLTRQTGSDLYIGGQGIHLITAAELENAESAGLAQVAGREAAPDVQDLVVGEAPDGGTAVWALLHNGDLMVAKRPAPTSGWGAALRLRGGVQEMAPVRGDEEVTTSLLVVYSDYRAGFIWQEAGHGVWQESPIQVADPERVTLVTCYGTSLRVLGEGSIPQPGVKVKVSASVLSSVVLNGHAVFIGPGVPAETQSDLNGGISLFDRVRSLTPAIYRFSVDGIPEDIDVNPAGGVHRQFQSVTADELRQASLRTPGGDKPLLAESFRTGPDRNQVDVVAGALNQMASLALATDGVAPGVRQVSANGAFSSALRPEVLPDGYRWGLQADAQGVRPAGGDVMDGLIGAAESVGEFFVDLGESIVDFFEGIGERIKEGWTFVLHKAEEAFEFICALGDQVKRFVLSTLEEVGAFFTWLWEQIKTGLERLWEWLKFIFDWEDILLVRDALVDAADDMLQHLHDSVGSMQDYLAAGIDQALDMLRQWRAEAGLPPAELSRPAPGESILDIIGDVTGPVQDLIDQAMGNSVVAWVMDKLDSLLDEIIQIEVPDPAPETVDATRRFFAGLLTEPLEALWDCLMQIQTDLARFFGGTMPGVGDFNFETIKNVIIAVGADALEGVLTMLRDLALRLLDLMQSLVGAVRDVLFATIRFPFIERLVNLVTAGLVSVDTSFRLVDGVLLLLAIPATIAYKVMFGEAPLKEGQVIALPYGRIAVQSATQVAWEVSSALYTLVDTFVKLAGAIFNAGKRRAYVRGRTVEAGIGWQEAVALGLSTIGLCAEYNDLHETESKAVRGLEGANIAVSGAMLIKSLAFTRLRRIGRTPSGSDGKSTERLDKFDAWLDIGGCLIHAVLLSVAHALVLDEAREEDVPCESLSLTGGVLNDAGSVLLTWAGLANSPHLAVAGGVCVAGSAAVGFAETAVSLC